MLWLWMSAMASPVEVERARVHLDEGRVVEAYDLLRPLAVESTDPRTIWSWLRACDLGGLKKACRAELSVSDDGDVDLVRQWFDRIHHGLEVASATEGLSALAHGNVEGSDEPLAMEERLSGILSSNPDGAAAEATQWLEEHPEHPDVLAVLYAGSSVPSKALGKLQNVAIKTAKKALKNGVTTEVAYRWHRLLLQLDADEVLATFADQLVSAGEGRPMSRAPASRVQQVSMAKQVLDQGPELLKALPPTERELVGLKALQMARSDNRTADVNAIFDVVLAGENVSPEFWLAGVDAALEQNDLEAASKRADALLVASQSVFPADLLGTDRGLRRIALGKALAARGAVNTAKKLPMAGVVDLMVANQLTGGNERMDVLERVMDQSRFGLTSERDGLETRQQAAHARALEDAKKKLENEDFDGALASVDSALRVLIIPAHKKARLAAPLVGTPELASAYATRALVNEEAGRPRDAATDLTTAILLVPWSAPADWWEKLGDLKTDRTRRFPGAMAVWTSEQAEDEDEEGDTAPSAMGSGPDAFDAALVTGWMQGSEDDKPDEEAVIVTRGRVTPFVARTGRGRGGSGGKGAAYVGRPSVNQPFPIRAIPTATGGVSLERGRITIVSFVRSDSASSRRLMAQLPGVARKMRGEGLDVGLVGVVMDPSEQDANALERLGQSWSAFTWNPDLGSRLGVTAVPTTWILDSSGVARFVHVGYLGPADYETEVRYISAR